MPRNDDVGSDPLRQLLEANRQSETARRRIQERIATRVRPTAAPDAATHEYSVDYRPMPDPSRMVIRGSGPEPTPILSAQGSVASNALPVGMLRTHEVAPHDTTVITERWDGTHWALYNVQPRDEYEQEQQPIYYNANGLPTHDPYGAVAIPARPPSDVGRLERLYREEVDGTIHVDEVSMPSDTTLGRPRSRTNSRLPQEPGYIQTVRTIISSQKCNLRLVKRENGFTLGITSPRNTNSVDLINIRENRHREADPRGFVFMRIPVRGDRFAHGMQLVERSHEDYGTQIVVKEIKGE